VHRGGGVGGGRAAVGEIAQRHAELIRDPARVAAAAGAVAATRVVPRRDRVADDDRERGSSTSGWVRASGAVDASDAGETSSPPEGAPAPHAARNSSSVHRMSHSMMVA
jgi:hypothetical protein